MLIYFHEEIPDLKFERDADKFWSISTQLAVTHNRDVNDTHVCTYANARQLLYQKIQL